MERRLMHCIHQVALLGAEFQPPKLSPQLVLRRQVASRWPLSRISTEWAIENRPLYYSV